MLSISLNPQMMTEKRKTKQLAYFTADTVHEITSDEQGAIIMVEMQNVT